MQPTGCVVVLKTGKFHPVHAGELSFHVAAIDVRLPQAEQQALPSAGHIVSALEWADPTRTSIPE